MTNEGVLGLLGTGFVLVVVFVTWLVRSVYVLQAEQRGAKTSLRNMGERLEERFSRECAAACQVGGRVEAQLRSVEEDVALMRERLAHIEAGRPEMHHDCPRDLESRIADLEMRFRSVFKRAAS